MKKKDLPICEEETNGNKALWQWNFCDTYLLVNEKHRELDLFVFDTMLC